MHKKQYLDLKRQSDANITKFHEMTRSIQSLKHDNELLYKHKSELEHTKVTLQADLLEKSKQLERLEKDLNNLGLRLKYNQ